VLTVAKVACGRERYYLAATLEHSEAGAAESSVLGALPRLREVPGYWLGRGAEQLGLTGEVAATAFERVLAGEDPASGELLSLRHGRVRVRAFDCTFSAPKSLSLLYALGPAEAACAVRDAQCDAVAAVLGYLEREAGALRRRDRGRLDVVPAEGLAAACFLHRVSRALDPHLHTHVVVANLAADDSGRWSALDARPLFASLAAARDLYDAHLRAALGERLDCRWRGHKGAAADLEGIGEEVVAAFSRRRDAIREDLEARGVSGRRASVVAGHRTRPPKDLELSYDELVGRWRDRALALGLSDRRLASLAEVRSARRGGAGRVETARRGEGAVPPAPGLPGWCAATVGAGGRADAVAYGELVRARCRSAAEGVRRDAVDAEIAELLARGVLVHAPSVLGPATGAKGPRGPRRRGELLTTPDVLEELEALEVATRRAVESGRRVEMLAYPPGERLVALDRLSSLKVGPAPPALVAPNPAAASRAEAATGLLSTSVSSWLADRESGREETVVLLDAHRLRARELRRLLEEPSPRPLLLVVPERRDRAPSVAGPVLCVASPADLDAFRHVPEAGGEAAPPGREPVLRLSVCGEEVVVSGDPVALRAALVADARRAASAGVRVAVGVPNRAVGAGLAGVLGVPSGATCAGSSGPGPLTQPVGRGEEAPLVLVSPAGALAEARGAAVLLSLGGARVEPSPRGGALARHPQICRYLVVADANRGTDAGGPLQEAVLGRILEAVAPRELCSRLGPPPDSLSARAAWRSAALALERRGLVPLERRGLVGLGRRSGSLEPEREPSFFAPARESFWRSSAKDASRLLGR